MDEVSRYAVYYAPPPGPLAEFGAAWLGWDMQTGRQVDHPRINGLNIAAITQTPRKYGFHATIKPPFRLAEGFDASRLVSQLGDLCRAQPPVTLSGLRLSRIGRFIALTAEGDASTLNAMAAKMVADLDPFRAAPTNDELAKRRKHRLSVHQDALLMRWGYPYVMDEFRFHITLSGGVANDLADKVQAELERQLATIPMRPFTLESLCLVGEGADGRFRLIERVPLTG